MAIVLLPYTAGDCRLCSELWACIPAISSLICLLLILMAFRLAASLGLSTLVLNPFPPLLKDLAPVWAQPLGPVLCRNRGLLGVPAAEQAGLCVMVTARSVWSDHVPARKCCVGTAHGSAGPAAWAAEGILNGAEAPSCTTLVISMKAARAVKLSVF